MPGRPVQMHGIEGTIFGNGLVLLRVEMVGGFAYCSSGYFQWYGAKVDGALGMTGPCNEAVLGGNSRLVGWKMGCC